MHVATALMTNSNNAYTSLAQRRRLSAHGANAERQIQSTIVDRDSIHSNGRQSAEMSFSTAVHDFAMNPMIDAEVNLDHVDVAKAAPTWSVTVNDFAASTVILIALIATAIELFSYYYAATFRSLWTTTSADRSSLQRITTDLRSLRDQMREYDSPSTFTQFALTQRAYNKKVKELTAVKQQMEPTSTAALVSYAAVHLPRILALIIIAIVLNMSVASLHTTSTVDSLLSFTPLRVSYIDGAALDNNTRQTTDRFYVFV